MWISSRQYDDLLKIQMVYKDLSKKQSDTIKDWEEIAKDAINELKNEKLKRFKIEKILNEQI